jgi:5-formyltetrahydrofolate cyclo-ligase
MSSFSGLATNLLHKELRQTRRDIPASLRATYDEAISKHLLGLIDDQHVQSVAAYCAFDGEPDLVSVCRKLINDARIVALPVVSEDSNGVMEFHRWNIDTPLSSNQYGINEPPKSTPMPVSDFDMLLIPMVGYDKSGNRIGMGAGYYDRHLESIRELGTPVRVGVAYSSQEINSIKQNQWDIPLHGVVNENGWTSFI